MVVDLIRGKKYFVTPKTSNNYLRKVKGKHLVLRYPNTKPVTLVSKKIRENESRASETEETCLKSSIKY